MGGCRAVRRPVCRARVVAINRSRSGRRRVAPSPSRRAACRGRRCTRRHRHPANGRSRGWSDARVVAGVEAHVDRALDLRRVAADVGAVPVEHLALAPPLVDVAERRVPVLRVRATIRSVRLSPLPPMAIGGCGRCTGFGSHHASREREVLPVERRPGPSISSSMMTCTPSSNWSKRSFSGGRRMPSASDSSWFQPAPRPMISRPALMTSMRGGHVRQHRRVAVRHPGDLAAEA